MPLGKAHVEPTRLQTASMQKTNGIVGIDAVRAAAVGDDLPSTWKARRELVQGCDRSGPGTGDVAGAKLGLGSNVEDDRVSASEAIDQLGCRDLLDLATLAEVLLREHAHLCDVSRGDVAHGRPELCHAVARQAVVDPAAVTSRPGETARREKPEVMGSSRDALAGFLRNLLYGALALGKEIDNLGAPAARKRARNGCECVEECCLGVMVVDLFKLSFEGRSVKRV